MRRTRALAVASLVLVVALACTRKNPAYCLADSDCASGRCDVPARQCIHPSDGGMDAGSDADAADARDASEASDAAPKCTASTQCADGGVDSGGPVCEVEAGLCVECVADGDCAARKKTTPICEAHACRACKTDTECPDPNICMTDGHCATTDEVLFVEFKATGCSPATGSSASPFCLPNDVLPSLAAGRNVIVIRGSANGQLTLATTNVAPVVIGKPDASNVPGSIPAVASTGISVSSDNVLIRDLTVNTGTAKTSVGIVVGGSSTTLKLLNVQVNLGGDGLGIQATAGAQLTMDRCTVNGNPKGGIFISGAAFDIENTTVNNNGPSADVIVGGIRIQNTTGIAPARLKLLTIKTNNPSGVSCDAPIVDQSGVLANGNTSADISGTCGFSPCTMAGATCGAPPQP